MAPAATGKGGEADNTDASFLVNFLANCGELALDAKSMAEALGIAQQYNIYPKMRRILNRYGFTYDSNSKKVIPLESGGEGNNSVESPNKAAKRKKVTTTSKPCKKTTATPKSKNKAGNEKPVKEEQVEEEQAVVTETVLATSQLKKVDGMVVSLREEDVEHGFLARLLSRETVLATPQPKKTFLAEAKTKEQNEEDDIIGGPVMEMETSPGFADWPNTEEANEDADFA